MTQGHIVASLGPTYEKLAAGPWRNRPVQGKPFWFTLGGGDESPVHMATLKQHSIADAGLASYGVAEWEYSFHHLKNGPSTVRATNTTAGIRNRRARAPKPPKWSRRASNGWPATPAPKRGRRNSGCSVRSMGIIVISTTPANGVRTLWAARLVRISTARRRTSPSPAGLPGNMANHGSLIFHPGPAPPCMTRTLGKPGANTRGRNAAIP